MMDTISLLVILQLGIIASLFIYGIVILARPKWHQDRHWARHNAKLQDRLARGKDAYFEELRSLEAYRPFASTWQQRLTGMGSIILAILYAAKLYRSIYF